MHQRGYCGYDCSLCPGQSDDIEERAKLVEVWRKYFGHQAYTLENVRCDGCKADGRIADKQCEARPCAKEKGLEFCMDCNQFPCDKVRKLMGTKEGMILFCLPKTYELTEEEYNFGMAQFASMPFILERLQKNGKMKNWN
jgi:hypothetical protein